MSNIAESASDGVTAGAFLQSLRECSSILSGIPKTTKDHTAFKQEVGALFELHTKLISRITPLCETPNALHSQIFKKKAAVMVADVIGTIAKMFQYDNGLVFRAVDELIPIVQSRAESVDILIEDIASTDVVMNVKFSLLTASLRFDALLNHFPLFGSRRVLLQWFNDFSAELARDIAFNWSKKSSISDRHFLFQSVLSIVSDLLIESWAGKAIEHLHQAEQCSAFAPFTIWESFSSLGKLLAEVDIVDHKNLSIGREEAMALMKPRLVQIVQSFTLPDAHKLHTLTFQSAIAALLDEKATESVRHHMSQNAGSEGRATVRLQDALEIVEMCAQPATLFSALQPLDLVSVERRARSTLSYLWGLSNAVSKIK